LPAKTASARAWAAGLAALAALPETIAAAAHWVGQSDSVRSMPTDAAQSPLNTNGDAATVSVTLGARERRALVHDVPRRLEASAQAVLLAGLLLAWRRWTGHDALRVDVEGHGRNVLGDAMDVSRTVGWFTTVFPVHLTLVAGNSTGKDPSAEGVIGDVQAALDALPLAGASHGLVRYLAPNGPARAALSAQPRPEVLFNYLGAHDVSLPAASRLRVTDEPHGRSRSADAPRAYLLEINTRLENGALIADIEYSARAHTSATMERFAEHLRESLSELAMIGTGASVPYGLAQLDAPALATVADLLSELDDA
jgi:non-ribosomal peptide synthase protein (TIGR01720 family)